MSDPRERVAHRLAAPSGKALIAEIAAERGLWPDQVAVMLASQLVLDEADDAAYRRVCERKGLLPL